MYPAVVGDVIRTQMPTDFHEEARLCVASLASWRTSQSGVCG